MEKELETFYPKNRKEWREWLHDNHDVKESIWLIYFKKKANVPTVAYSVAVDEALCFGWIDSKAKAISMKGVYIFLIFKKWNILF
jgi:uncharacterized protein YdeI (YjbR/CyaY-like superfamily)